MFTVSLNGQSLWSLDQFVYTSTCITIVDIYPNLNGGPDNIENDPQIFKPPLQYLCENVVVTLYALSPNPEDNSTM